MLLNSELKYLFKLKGISFIFHMHVFHDLKESSIYYINKSAAILLLCNILFLKNVAKILNLFIAYSH